MKNAKALILIVLAVVLVGALGYLTYLISDGSNPLSMFNLRASNPDEEIDPFLAELEDSGVPANSVSPSPTTVVVAYNSTSPTLAPSGVASPSASISATLSPSVEPTFTPTPTLFNVVLAEETPTPTTVKALPVSGITDHLDKIIIGGGFLILLGLLL